MNNINRASMISTANLRALEKQFGKPTDMTQALILRGIQAELAERSEERRIVQLESEIDEARGEVKDKDREIEDLQSDKDNLRGKIDELKSKLSEAGESNAEAIVKSVLGCA